MKSQTGSQQKTERNEKKVAEEKLDSMENENYEDKENVEETAETDCVADAGADFAANGDIVQETADAPEEKSLDKAEKKRWKAEKKADKKKDAWKEKVEELEDRVKRQMAEFENFRKRTEKEKAAMFETGAKSVIEKILPTVDNFERGLQAISAEDKKTPFAEGMHMVYKQLMTELENIGVEPIEALGVPFDPNVHHAVMQVESEEYEEGTVAQELQKGYTYRGSVIRHSMVAVVQ